MASGASSGSVQQRLLGVVLIDFLHLLGALPEKQIGADGGAEDRHDGDGGAFGQIGMKADHARADGAPVQRQQEDDRDIGEQAEGQHHQEARISAIGNEQLQSQRQEGEEEGEDMLVAAP